MDLKKIIGVLGFLVLGFMPKGMARLQAYLVIDSATYGIGNKFMTYKHKITSNENKMGITNCWTLGGGTPTFKIENDSIFLTKLLINIRFDQPDESAYIYADLTKEFKGRCVNGRVFAKEINSEILASRANLFKTDSLGAYYSENLVFLTIKHGKVVKQIEFTGVTRWAIADLTTEIPHEEQSTDWYVQPNVPLNGGTRVVAQITVDDKEKLTKIEIAEGGDKRWNKAVLNIINRLSKWQCSHICYTEPNIPNVRYKKDKVIFIVKKPR
jgi:hypothetical protein